jgi:hypothetical protein
MIQRPFGAVFFWFKGLGPSPAAKANGTATPAAATKRRTVIKNAHA